MFKSRLPLFGFSPARLAVRPLSLMYSCAGMLLLAGFGFAPGAFAAPPVENTQCILGQPGAPNGLNCTANDVTLSSPAVTVIDRCQFPGDTATLQVLADITGTAQDRYDIGVWVSVDGDPNGDGAESGLCSVVSIPNDIFDTNGISVNIDGDNCGDVNNTGNVVDIAQADLGTFSVLCNDSDGDGQLNLPLIISWNNQPGGVCAVSTDTVPSTPAKCRANIDNNIPVPVPGRLIVNKTTTGGDPTAFSFNLTGTDSGIVGGFDGDHTFPLASGQQFDSATAFTGGLLAGAYVLTEAPAVGWVSEGSCASDVDGTNTNPASLALRAGETITCNFTNTPDTGTLTVVKQSIGGVQSFSFVGTGSIGNFALDTTGSNPVQTQFVVTSGSYDLTETIPVNWSLTSASCSGATSNGTPNLATGAITGITISGGENVTCTFVNAATSTITVTKLTEGGDGAFDFTSTLPGVNPFQVTTTGGSGSIGTPFQIESQTSGNIVETVPDGWEFVSASCTGATASSSIANGVDLTVNNGETIACTFRNRKLATLVIEKVTDPANATQFPFTSSLWIGESPVTAGQPEIITNQSPGTHTVTESDPTPLGYDLTGLVCVDSVPEGTASTVDLDTRTATYELDPGETVTCTFTNTQQASLTVEKVLDGDPTGLTTSFAFTRSFGADFNLDPVNTPGSVQFDNLQPDTALTVTETIPTTAGWALLSATCGVGETVNLSTGTISNIVLDPGEQATCTFTNTVPTLMLEKTGTLDDGGDGIANVGDTINYVFTVTNTGKVALSNIVVADADPDVTVVGSPIEGLAPGASDDTVTGSYVLTQVDIDAGTFSNTATATSDEGATDDDDDTQPLAPTPAIMLSKTGTLNDDDGNPGVTEGDTISYAFTVTNTGNVTLTNVTLVDTVAGVTINGGPIASLAPAAVDSTTFTGSYTITQGDIDAGSFTNTATAIGDCPQSPACATDMDSDTQQMVPPRPPGEPQAIPVNNPWAILLLTLMVLALGWYFRPPMRRNF